MKKNNELPEVYKDYPQLQKYNVADLAIAKMEAEFSKLKITDLKDTAGYKTVSSAIAVVRSKRLEVEKVRKDLKADSLNYGRIVDSEAKRIQALIEPIETRLQAEKDRIDTEKENIRLEKERKIQELLDSRKNKLYQSGMVINSFGNLYYKEYVITLPGLQDMTEEAFNEFYNKVQEQIKADQETKAIEEAEQEKKRLELIAESERLEKLRQEQAMMQAKIDEDNRKIQAEKDRLQREKEMAGFKAKAQAEAKLNAEKLANAEIRLQKEKADAEIQRLKDEADKKEQEKLKAEQIAKERLEEEQRQREQAKDKDKLLLYVEDLKAVPVPQLKSLKMRQLMQDVTNLVKKIEDYVDTHTGGKK